jgi:hypothetical protein
MFKKPHHIKNKEDKLSVQSIRDRFKQEIREK